MPKHENRRRRSRYAGVLTVLLPVVAFSMILAGFVIVFGFLLAVAG